MSRTVRRAWNGGSPEAARAEANARRDKACGILREAHDAYLTDCHPFDITRPFKSHAAPGWVYLVVEDTVILTSTYDEILNLGRGRPQ